MDAFKLTFLAKSRPRAQMILLFSDELAAAPFATRRWYAQAIRELGISVEVVDIPDDMRRRLLEAQNRQYR